MATITHRELRNNSAEILRRVNAGEIFDVTNNGQLAATVSPPVTDSLERLRLQGKVRPATKRVRWQEAFADAPTLDVTTEEILADVRGE
ncbi:type II toxin-antitoxin system prevent-host-death family antitoxin [Luteococcus sp. H138]|uniref:type II toxin-antitoxin system Phd/YefM family antitoxin n=1 Tax=unclassified Luteococcus TaxID=2639923 RepID=UPI00313D5396